jgi:phage/plasmid-like protein (TIGR03299 family)
MSHNLAINPKTQNASFFTVREKAWHKLGLVLDNCPTSQEAIVYAGLDYTVEKAQLQAYTLPLVPDAKIEHDNCPYSTVRDLYATVRTDNMDTLGVVGKNYHIVQNKDAFGFFDSIVGKGAAIYETAGALGKGEVTFISAKLPSNIRVNVNGKEDMIDKYLLLTNSHDGSAAIRILFTPVRVVCNNTLNLALRSNEGISIRHTSRVYDEIEKAAELLGIINKEYNKAEETYQHLANIKITDKALREYIDIIFPSKEENEEVSTRLANIRKKVFEYTMDGAGQDDIRGTAWAAYNGVTGYFQNVRTYGDYEKLFKTNILGSGHSVMHTALKEALKLA